MKLWGYLGIAVVILALSGYIIKQYKDIKQLQTQQLAIKNPDKTEAKIITRIITKVVKEPSGTTTTETTNETEANTASTTATVPTIPVSGVSSTKSLLYLSGAYGADIQNLSSRSWGVGAGLNLGPVLSLGLRFDTFSATNRIAVEGRVNF